MSDPGVVSRVFRIGVLGIACPLAVFRNDAAISREEILKTGQFQKTLEKPEMLDLSGLNCPEVVLRVKEFVKQQPPGSRLEIVSTDPLSQIDIPLFVLKGGHELVSGAAEGRWFRFVIVTRAPGA